MYTRKRVWAAYLVGHDITEEGDVTRVNAHAVGFHCVLDLVNDRPARGFDTQDLGDLNDMV
jgi:hypothetical protein